MHPGDLKVSRTIHTNESKQNTDKTFPECIILYHSKQYVSYRAKNLRKRDYQLLTFATWYHIDAIQYSPSDGYY